MLRLLLLLTAASALCAPAAAEQNAAAEPVAQSDAAPALLVYSKTTGWRHDSIDEAWAALAGIASERGWTVVFTEDPAWFEAERLAEFDAVVWALPTGDTLSDLQKASFRTFVEGGGGFVGLHSAGDSSHTWDWYRENLIGAGYRGHPGDPNVRDGTLHVEDTDHVATLGLPAEWNAADEWYSFADSVHGAFHVLATIDETTYLDQANEADRALAMGSDHPMVWVRCVGEGRSFYSALGHTAESYSDPAMRALIAGGISWSLGEGDCPAR